MHIIFDACHMLKLIRNCFGDLKEMRDLEGHSIKWSYVRKLVEIQDNEGLRAGNRLKAGHIAY